MELDEIIAWVIAAVMLIVVSVLTIGLIILCAFIIQWFIEMIGFDIDDVLYWTGVGLIILFSVFCKSSYKSE